MNNEKNVDEKEVASALALAVTGIAVEDAGIDEGEMIDEPVLFISPGPIGAE